MYCVQKKSEIYCLIYAEKHSIAAIYLNNKIFEYVLVATEF